MARKHKPMSRGEVAVIGLGRFGCQVALSLEALGHDVLAVDESQERVQWWAQRLRNVLQADGTDNRALQQIGVPEFERVVVGISTNVEASVLTVLALSELGIEEIWASATSTKHAKILSSVGARHVIYPEAAMGDRVAHLIMTKMLDYIEFEDDFAIAKTCAPKDMVGMNLAESGLRAKYGVTVVGVKRPGEAFEYGGPNTVVSERDILIVAGTNRQVGAFAAAT